MIAPLENKQKDKTRKIQNSGEKNKKREKMKTNTNGEIYLRIARFHVCKFSTLF